MTEPERFAACHIGHRDLNHCSTPIRAVGRPTVILGASLTTGDYAEGGVFSGGKPWSCVGDVNQPHLKPGGKKCINHTAPIGRGSSTVIVEGRPAGLVTSNVTGCTQVADGIFNVHCSF